MTTSGIDIAISRLVGLMTAKLWTGKSVEFNGRAYINSRGGGTVPEIFDNTIGRYRDVLLDSSKSGIVFFDWQNKTVIEGQHYAATVWIQFAVNLQTLYPTETARADELAHQDALKWIQKSEFKPTALVTGLESFRQYTAFDGKEHDMQPFHLFRVECQVNYNYQNC